MGLLAGSEERVAHSLHQRHLQTLRHLQQSEDIVCVDFQVGSVHVVEQLPDLTHVLARQSEDIALLCLEQRPEVDAEGCQDVPVSFETNAFHHQSAVTQEPLDPLLLQLLQQETTVAVYIHLLQGDRSGESGSCRDSTQFRTKSGPKQDLLSSQFFFVCKRSSWFKNKHLKSESPAV